MRRYFLSDVFVAVAVVVAKAPFVRADRESKHSYSQDTEWMINPILLRNALDTLDFKPEIDLFASRLNRQFPIYCSFQSDPEASCIDAFTIILWTEKKIYSYPPFSCVLRVLQKIIEDRATGVLVVPMCLSQSWYPILTTLLLLPAVTLPPSKSLLSLPEYRKSTLCTRKWAFLSVYCHATAPWPWLHSQINRG